MEMRGDWCFPHLGYKVQGGLGKVGHHFLALHAEYLLCYHCRGLMQSSEQLFTS